MHMHDLAAWQHAHPLLGILHQIADHRALNKMFWFR
jgi:hypothetical protein